MRALKYSSTYISHISYRFVANNLFKIPEQWTIRGHTINFCGVWSTKFNRVRSNLSKTHITSEEYKDDVNMYFTNCDVASMVLLCVHFTPCSRDSLILAIGILFANDVGWLFIVTTPLRHLWVSLNVQELFSTNMVIDVKRLPMNWRNVRDFQKKLF